MFKTLPKSIRSYIAKKSIISQFNILKIVGPFEFNNWAVFDDAYQSSPALKDFFKITAYSYDGVNQRYIAAIEANQYPIYAF